MRIQSDRRDGMKRPVMTALAGVLFTLSVSCGKANEPPTTTSGSPTGSPTGAGGSSGTGGAPTTTGGGDKGGAAGSGGVTTGGGATTTTTTTGGGDAGGSGNAGSAGSAGAGRGGGGGSDGGAGTGGAGGAGGSVGPDAGGSAGAGGAAGTGMGGTAGAAGASVDGGAVDPRTTVVMFTIDGTMNEAIQTAAANGGVNLKFVLDNGVRVETSYSTSPAARMVAANGSATWGNSTSGNTAVVTGTHVFEAPSPGLDDLFSLARTVGIKSAFSGGDDNYRIYTTPDFEQSDSSATDDVVVQRAVGYLKNDGVRLLRVHLQRIRDDWTGPAAMTNPSSTYIVHLLQNDMLLGTIIQALKDMGVWEHSYLVLNADHGMGTSSGSSHPPNQLPSWKAFMAFYGPGLKRGATIPYGELPDIAVTVARFLGLPPLKGHTAANVNLAVKGTTGVYLSNLLQGAPADLPAHPKYIERYLNENTYPNMGSDFIGYRDAMYRLIR
jgi:hypothetical protein